MSTQRSIDVSPNSSGSGIANVAIVDQTRVVPFLILSSVFAGAAVIGVVFLMLFIIDANDNNRVQYQELEREVRLLQLQTDNLKNAMIVHGMDPAPHLEGEAP